MRTLLSHRDKPGFHAVHLGPRNQRRTTWGSRLWQIRTKNLHTGRAQSLGAPSRSGVRVCEEKINAANTRLNQCLRTRTREASVVTGLQSHNRPATAGAVAGLLQCHHFSVCCARALCMATAYHYPGRVFDHRTDRRVRASFLSRLPAEAVGVGKQRKIHVATGRERGSHQPPRRGLPCRRHWSRQRIRPRPRRRTRQRSPAQCLHRSR